MRPLAELAKQHPEQLLRWLSAVFFIGALGAALWRVPAGELPAFMPPSPAESSVLPAVFSSSRLPQIGSAASTPTLTQLADGRLACAYVAGATEDPELAAIWFSTLGKNGWSEPEPVATRESTAGSSFANVRRLEQPVLYAEGSWLHLWYIGTALGRSLYHIVSTDGGHTWSGVSRLPTNPLAGLGSGLHGPAIPLADGGIGLPISHDFISAHGEWLRLSSTGMLLDKTRMPLAMPASNPAVVVLGEQQALALLSGPGKIEVATSNNGGLLWEAGTSLPFANANTPLALLRLKSGQLLLAGNPASGRDTLQLWLSSDGGLHWQTSRMIETAADGAANFSDPSLLQGRDGRIHLAYTWRRQAIRHVTFSEAWLTGAQQ